MKKIKNIKQIFNKKGDWITYIDPYRCDGNNPIYQYLFDKDGYINMGVYEEAREYAHEIDAPWHSELVRFIYSEAFDVSCKNNYTAIYAWRH